MNISVPDDLKARIDKVREDVNWSSIACRAFEQKLGEIASRKERKTMVDVIQRLRASKQRYENEFFREGARIGAKWAKEQAEVRELRNLDRFYQSHRKESFNADILAAAIRPESERGIGARDHFWRAVGADTAIVREYENGDWLSGFAEGVLNVWDDVKDKI
jgi:hypothetical protein